MTRILIVDDQLLFAESLKTVLEGTQDDFRICAIANDGNEAIHLVAAHSPGLILMDVRMPRMDGVEATRIIHSRYPHIPIIMLTTFEDDEYVREALTYGAAGYLLKNIPSRELVASIRAVLSGALLIDPRVIGALVGKRPADPENSPPPIGNAPWYDELSRKERQVLDLVVQGYHNDEIASRLCMADQTVRNYISRIYGKMEVDDRVQAVRKARETGLF